MKKLLLLLIILWPVASWSGQTDPIYYSTEDDAHLLSSLPTVHAPIASVSQRTLNNDSATPLYYHMILGVTIDVDANGQTGVPSGRTIDSVTMYLNTVSSSAANVVFDVREVIITPATPTWNEYDYGNTDWNNKTVSNSAHVSDTTGSVGSATTTTTAAETLTIDISTAEEFDGATVTGPISMYFLIRLSSSGNSTIYTTGANRPRFVFDYSGAQPPTPTPTNTPTETPTNTYTPSNTPTTAPATNTPTPTSTPLPTALPILVAGVGGIASPANDVVYDVLNDVFILNTLKFGDGTSVSTAGSVGDTTNYVDLGDTPSGLAGDALKVLRVNSGETAIEHVGISSIAAVPTHTHTTDAVTEGSNLYYTAERANDEFQGAIVAGSGISATKSDAGNTVTLWASGLTTTNMATDTVSQWTNDAGYLTSVSGISLGAIDSGWTKGALAFGDSGEAAALDASNLFWDDGNNRLGIGTGTPATALAVASAANQNQPISNAYTNLYVDVTTAGSSGIGGMSINAEEQCHYRFMIDDAMKWQIRCNDTQGEDLHFYSFGVPADVFSLDYHTGAADFNYSLNVDGSGTIDQGLTVGDSSNTGTKVSTPVMMTNLGSFVLTEVSNERYWEGGSTDPESLVVPMPPMLAGSVLDEVRILITDTGASGANQYAFDLNKTSTDIGDAFIGSTLDSSTGNDTAAGLTNITSNDYYGALTGGSLPYTTADGDAIELIVTVDPDSAANTCRIYSVHWIFNGRKY